MHYCSQGEGNWRYTAHVSGEGDWCSTVLREGRLGCITCLRTGVMQGAVPSLLVDSDDESRQLAIVKFGKHFGFCFQQKIIGFI